MIPLLWRSFFRQRSGPSPTSTPARHTGSPPRRTVDEVENLSLIGLAERYAPLQPAYLGQCRNNIRTARRGAAIPCEHQLPRPAGQLSRHANPTPPTETIDDLIRLQQRILRLLDPSDPADTVIFGQPAAVSCYFTNLRLITNLVRATWPVARRLALSPALAGDLDLHVGEQRALIAEWWQNNHNPAGSSEHHSHEHQKTGHGQSQGGLHQAVLEPGGPRHGHQLPCHLSELVFRGHRGQLARQFPGSPTAQVTEVDGPVGVAPAPA